MHRWRDASVGMKRASSVPQSLTENVREQLRLAFLALDVLAVPWARSVIRDFGYERGLTIPGA